jgi:glycosyltransferase involved in cell wall biosynthesis
MAKVAFGSHGMAAATGISVVIPLFNKGHCIARAIQSVLDQTVPCSEIIVVDDGSTDDGPSVVQSIEESRIKLFHQENHGPSAARNKGIEEACGELIAFLDADDEWKPWFLEAILQLWTKHPQAGAYATACEIREADGRVYTHIYREIPPAPWQGIIPNYFRSALWDNPVWTSAVVIRRQVFDRIGRFVLCPGLGQDVELWARIALQYPIAFSWRVGAVYHREAENRRCETVFTHVFASDSFERALRGLDVASPLLPDVREFLAREKLVAASRYILDGQSRLGRNLLKHCQTQRFLKRKLWWWFWSLLPHGLVRLAWRGKRWLRLGRRVPSRGLFVCE